MAHGDTRIIPLELQETYLPLRIEEFTLRADSGGAGKFRGGLGFRKSYRMLAECGLQTNLDRTKFPPWGVHGGKEASPDASRWSMAAPERSAPSRKKKGSGLRQMISSVSRLAAAAAMVHHRSGRST